MDYSPEFLKFILRLDGMVVQCLKTFYQISRTVLFMLDGGVRYKLCHVQFDRQKKSSFLGRDLLT